MLFALKKRKIRVGFFCREGSHDPSGSVRTGVHGLPKSQSRPPQPEGIQEKYLPVIPPMNLAHLPPK